MRVPISLILDDGAPVNIMYWTHPHERHVNLVPNAFTRAFGEVCATHGVRGKFSVLPMPAGLGRLDRGLSHVPRGHLSGFLDAVRKRIAPRFDITPELLTHDVAWNLERNAPGRLFEDAWVSKARVPELTGYLSLALRILNNVGLPANGVTSPWMTGLDNERVYAESIARAQWRVNRRRFSWYFLHFVLEKKGRWPWVAWRDRKKGLTVVSVPALTNDEFWGAQFKTARRAAWAQARAGADRLLSADGRRGRVRELFDGDGPIVLITHWQSLFSNGSRAGLRGLDTLCARINRTFGAEVEWVTCSELARRSLRRTV